MAITADREQRTVGDRLKRLYRYSLSRISTNVRLGELQQRIQQLEAQSHGSRATYVGNNRVLVKIFAGDETIAYFVPADDLLLSPWFIATGHFEPALSDYLRAEIAADSRCIDVGANFGFFTCLMARFARDGRVAGIEPDRRMWELVRDNIAINHLPHAVAIEAAAGAEDGEMTLYRRTTRSGNTSIVPADPAFTALMGEAPAAPFAVRALRLDALVDADFAGRLDFMKVDVEGAEPLVFDGAAGTIARNPQLAVVMEWSPGQIRAAGFDVAAFLRSLAGHGLKAHDMVSVPAPRRATRLVPLSYDELLNLPYRAGVVLRR